MSRRLPVTSITRVVLPLLLAGSLGCCGLFGCVAAATQPPSVDRSKMQTCQPGQQGQTQNQAGCTAQPTQ